MSIFSQSHSLFDTTTADPEGLLPLQSNAPISPQSAKIDRGTNLLSPDAPVREQMKNFPEDIYDLRDVSHLVRLMKALMGDAGTGQLKKRLLLARLESSLNGANFFDLDRFYGALFGAIRDETEVLNINPMDQTATPAEWDVLLASDANFRERIMQFAKAISMGATIPGLKAAAEAIAGVPVDVYESWQLLDAYGESIAEDPHSWDEIDDHWPTWNHFGTTTSWNQIENSIRIGRSTSLTPGEIIVKPNKNYDGKPLEQARDENALFRVLNVLKPASTIVTVDNTSGDIHIPAPIANMTADSEYWEVVKKVTPAPGINDVTSVYPLSKGQTEAGVDPLSSRSLPVPPFSQSAGSSWTTNSAIRTVSAYALDAGNGPGALYDDAEGRVYTAPNEDIVTYQDGTRVRHPATMGVTDTNRILMANLVGEGSLMAHPYSGDRKAVIGHD